MKAKRTWVLVADGARARIVRQLHPDREAEQKLDDLVFEIDHKRLREVMADRPGRSFASLGTRRSAMEYHSDPVQAQEEQFAESLIDTLVQHHSAGSFDALAIIAEPRMLGVLRRNLPASLRDLIAGEVAKDLTKLPALQLRAAIGDLGLPGLRADR